MMPNNAKWMTTLPARPQYGIQRMNEYLIDYVYDDNSVYTERYFAVDFIAVKEYVSDTNNAVYDGQVSPPEHIMIRNTDDMEHAEFYNVKIQTVTTLHLT